MNRRCCFTGHRDIPDDRYVRTMQLLRQKILKLCTEGYRIFNAGGALGFDTMAAQAVLKLKESFPDVQLHLYLPYPRQAEKWNKKDKAVYEYILQHSDRITYAADEYNSMCMNIRNRALVDNADLCIAYCTHPTGGTVYTMNYALDNGVDVVNIAAEL